MADSAAVPGIAMPHDPQTLVLFDVDGTLTPSRGLVSRRMLAHLRWLRTRVCIGIVGGSDLAKQREQLELPGAGVDGGTPDVLGEFDYVFSENGLVAHMVGGELARRSIREHLGEARLQEFVDFATRLAETTSVPVRRTNLVEVRTGLVNVSPCGRDVSAEERAEFARYDAEHGVRKRMVEILRTRFGHELAFALGGQISIDVFPHGWDKRYCISFVEHLHKTIHFFGDRTEPGGNDHEIYNDARIVGHAVTGPGDTLRQLEALFGAAPCTKGAPGTSDRST